MERIGNVRILFIAGFGPIVRDTAESRKLYSEILGISFKEESGEDLHRASEGRKNFRPVASFPGGAVLLWQGFLARRLRSARWPDDTERYLSGC